MNVSIIGITGYIGKNLSKYLINKGVSVTGIYRKDFTDYQRLEEKITGSDVVINMSGDSIIGFWTRNKKKRIYESRVCVTRKIVEIINRQGRNLVYINASAVGVYDNKNIHSEVSINYAGNFLAEVVIDWEKEVRKIENEKVRWIILRMGIVVGKDGGYLGKQNFMLRRGICVLVGRKNEYLPFISLKELMNVISFIIKDESINGIVNAVEPFTARVGEFYNYIRNTLKIIVFIKIPDYIVSILLGKASVIFLTGQCVIPDKLIKSKYRFIHTNMKSMFKSIMNKN